MMSYLPGQHARATYMRLDAARLLKRFFLCEEALIISQAGWLAAIAPHEIKLTLPRLLWEDAMCAHALRERVFELRFPSRVLEPGEDAPLAQLFAASLHAPGPAALLLALAQVYKPALLEAYRIYLALTDEIADGPSLRFLRQAVLEKSEQLPLLIRFAEELLLAASPEERAQAVAWVAAIKQRLEALGGVYPRVGAEQLVVGAPPSPELPGSKPFQLPDLPARDNQFHLCRFYWPDIFDPTAEYSEGVPLQLRSAISHFNEVWAVETAGAVLQAFASTLGWPFIYDAARWTYDESRHCRMGYERLKQWGFTPAELPLGSYIYESAAGQPPVYRLGMLFFFETKNIHKKQERIRAFTLYEDAVSRHDMEYDWADETIHAHFGKYWLSKLQELEPERYPPAETVRARCSELVAAMLQTITEAERLEIQALADSMLAKARLALDRLSAPPIYRNG
jgi:hypothetical protein